MIEFRQKGDFSKLSKFLERAKEAAGIGDLDKYGRAGVAALSSATPVDTGKTAASWTYEIKTVSMCRLSNTLGGNARFLITALSLERHHRGVLKFPEMMLKHYTP